MSDRALRLLERGDDPERYMIELVRSGEDLRLAQAQKLGLFKRDHDYRVEDLKVRFTVYGKGAEAREKTSIAFAHNNPDPAWERPPFGSKGENAENDKAWRRYNKEELRLMREQVERGLGLLGIKLPGTTAAKRLPFSRKAGCGACPCSPGFVLPALRLKLFYDSEEMVPHSWEDRIDIYVTRVKSVEECHEERKTRKRLTALANAVL